MITHYQLKSAVYGALIGDATGVPYEFKMARQIPAVVEMFPPTTFRRSWGHIKLGTYSDDGAQLLTLLEFLSGETHDFHKRFKTLLKEWENYGRNSVDHDTFDIGSQTWQSLNTDEDMDKLSKNGNGSLMRTLPVGLFYATDEKIIEVSHLHSSVTHPHIISMMCCAFYGMIVRRIIDGWNLDSALLDAKAAIYRLYQPEYQFKSELDLMFKPGNPSGSGYVLDSLWSAIDAVKRSTSYQDAVSNAIKFGEDTDTTACIAGGLAGLIYGFDTFPQQWVEGLRNQDHIDSIINLAWSSITRDS